MTDERPITEVGIYIGDHSVVIKTHASLATARRAALAVFEATRPRHPREPVGFAAGGPTVTDRAEAYRRPQHWADDTPDPVAPVGRGIR